MWVVRTNRFIYDDVRNKPEFLRIPQYGPNEVSHTTIRFINKYGKEVIIAGSFIIEEVD